MFQKAALAYEGSDAGTILSHPLYDGQQPFLGAYHSLEDILRSPSRGSANYPWELRVMHELQRAEAAFLKLAEEGFILPPDLESAYVLLRESVVVELSQHENTRKILDLMRLQPLLQSA